MDPKERFELGQKKGTDRAGTIFYGNLKLGNVFLPRAWVGIGDARVAQVEKDGAMKMFMKAIEIHSRFNLAWDRVKKHSPKPPTPL